MPEDPNPKPGSKEFMDRLRTQFADDENAEREIREEARKDVRFRAGDQWDKTAAANRKANDRPVMTFNKLGQYIQKVANEARQNKPQIKFAPGDDAADVDTAKLFEELARGIQYASDADVASENAIDNAAGSGFGFIRVVTEYADAKTFDQDIKIEAVLDPFSVYGVLIPAAFRKPPSHAFEIERMSKQEFERDFPGSDLAKSWDLGRDAQDWVETDSVRLARYWWVEWEAVEVVEENPPEDQEPRTRTEQVPHVWSCKTNGVEVMKGSETEWAGSCIPIFAVLGLVLVAEGKVYIFSLIRPVLDGQVLINFGKTRIVETLATSPISPFIGPKGFMRGNEKEWSQLNTKLTPALEYEVVDVAGHALPPPQRQVYEPPIGQLSAFVRDEQEDLKSGTGIYDAGLGNRSNETSGVAIQRRAQQSQTANFHFIDNLARTQKQVGQAVGEIMPKIMDTPRWLRAVGEDEAERMVRVNEPFIDPKTGETKTYMLTAGKYDVRVVVGPGYTTKRQETAALMDSAIQSAPALMNVLGDLYFGNLDAAGSDQMAKRMKKFIQMQSPGLIEEEGAAPEVPPEVQQQLQQSEQQMQEQAQQIEQMGAELQQAQAAAQGKQEEIASRERIEAAKLEAGNQVKAAEFELQRELKQMELSAQVRIEEIRAAAKLEESRTRLAQESELKLRQMALEQETERARAAAEVARAGQETAESGESQVPMMMEHRGGVE